MPAGALDVSPAERRRTRLAASGQVCPSGIEPFEIVSLPRLQDLDEPLPTWGREEQ
jgi:hypothetical protein